MTRHLLKRTVKAGTEQWRAVCTCGWESVRTHDERTAMQAHRCHKAQREEPVS